TRMAAIPIGGDPDDYRVLHELGLDESEGIEFTAERIHLSYVGTIWPRALGTVQTILRGVRRVRETHPALYAKLCLHFVGTDARLSAAANAEPHYQVRQLAQKEGVSDVVHEHPWRVPFLDALWIQARSHAVMIVGSTESHYSASKIFSVLMSGRPYLAVFHEVSNVNAILKRAGGGIALSFADG